MSSGTSLACTELLVLDSDSDGDADDGPVNVNRHAKRTYWFGTRMNPVEAEITIIKAITSEYLSIGWEHAPTTGTEHVHFVLRLGRGQQRSFAELELLLPAVHWGYFEQKDFGNKVYYYKDKCYRFEEFGDKGPPERRTRIRAQAAAQAAQHAQWRSLAEAGRSSEIPADRYAQYFIYFERMERQGLLARAKEASDNAAIEYELREWQHLLAWQLQDPPDSWKIIWCYDPVGRAGKSVFCRWYTRHHPDAEALLPGKAADMAYMLTPLKRVYFFDVPRIQGDRVAWGFVEMLKNGHIFCSKYNSHCIEMPIPHVVVLSNAMPPETTDTTGFSEGRIELIRLSESTIPSWVTEQFIL